MNNHECNDRHRCILCIYKYLVVFPEGTTTNCRSLIKFRSGIFYASNKYPIMPIAIYSNNRYFDFSDTAIYPHSFIFQVLTQFTNEINVIIGKPYVPNKDEMRDPTLYANNVNILISKMLGDVSIYLLNKEHKFKCYFEYLRTKWNGKHNLNEQQLKLIRETAKDISNRDNKSYHKRDSN